MSSSESSTPVPVTASNFRFNRWIRRIFPSTSLLTFNPLFRGLANASDVLPRLKYREFKTLPPNHLRIRVGVGNQLFNNQVHYLVHARDFWVFVFSEGLATMRSDFLDIGVGCGRWAHWLRDYNFRGRRLSGTYVGIDIDAEAIEWCKTAFDAERFRFHRSTDGSVSYNQDGSPNTSYRVPEADASFDLIFSNSLFTHLLEREVENYLRESFRLLRKGGSAMHSHFNLDHPTRTNPDRARRGGDMTHGHEWRRERSPAYCPSFGQRPRRA